MSMGSGSLPTYGPLLTDTNMAGAHSNPSWSRHLFKAVLMVLGALLLVYSASAQTHREFASPGQQKRESSADILTEIGRSLKETLDTWLGPETMHVISEVRKAAPAVAVCRKKRRVAVSATSPCHHILPVLVPAAESPAFHRHSLALLTLLQADCLVLAFQAFCTFFLRLGPFGQKGYKMSYPYKLMLMGTHNI